MVQPHSIEIGITFFLASVVPGCLEFHRTWWNFSEAGHGKGAADGVGAAVKRLADRCVPSGEVELQNACSLCSAVKPACVPQ